MQIIKFNKTMNYTKSEMKIIHKVFQHYLDSHDSDEETRDLFLENFRDLIMKAKPLMS